MAIFEVPTWLEIPMAFGLMLMTYATTLLIAGFACFLLVLTKFLLFDKP